MAPRSDLSLLVKNPVKAQSIQGKKTGRHLHWASQTAEGWHVNDYNVIRLKALNTLYM